MSPLFTADKCCLIPESSPLLVILNTCPVEWTIHFMTFSDDAVTLQGKDPRKRKDGGKNIFSNSFCEIQRRSIISK